MIQTLGKNRWLLALCGVVDAFVSVIYLVMVETDGPGNFHAWNSMAGYLGKLVLAAGVCTIAAGVWRSTAGKCWWLVMNGLAASVLGLIYIYLVRFRIGFATVALLIVLMAMSLAVLELGAARTLRRQRRVADGWFLDFAGATSIGFAVMFLALGLRWIGIGPGSHADLVWLGAYFGFSAICMLVLALRLPGPNLPGSARREDLPPLGRARHAH